MAFILRFALKALFEVTKALIKVTAELAKGLSGLAGSGRSPIRIKVKWHLESHFPQFKREAKEAMLAALEAAADTAVRSAKRRAPVRTGTLRRSIQRTDIQRTFGGGYTIAVFTDVPYARNVEYGTVYTPAQSFLRPAARVGWKKFEREVKAQLRKWN